MAQTDENINSWVDELSQLIRKKKEENEILKKLHDSLQHSDDAGNNATDHSSAENENKTETETETETNNQ